MFNWRDAYVGFLNMDERTDRLAHITDQLGKLGIPFHRTRGKLPSEFPMDDPKLQVQWKRTPGSIPCMYGQMEIMQNAYDEGKDAMVFEDDCHLCGEIQDRLDIMQKFLNIQYTWDVMWLGGTVHINPPYWHIHGKNPDLRGTILDQDAVRTFDKRFVKCHGAFCTYAYIVRHQSIPFVLELLESVVHESMGIDWSFIRLGDHLNTYMFLPGSVKQIDNRSNIGNGDTIFSGFAALGPYWYQESMKDFDYSTIKI
jgi:GR25 family glycosyltransferase involved in LPS biosynthesis